MGQKVEGIRLEVKVTSRKSFSDMSTDSARHANTVLFKST